MKRILAVLLAALCLLALGACTEPPEETQPAEEETLEKYDGYDLTAYTKPLWDGKYVYNESCMFVGEGDSAPLLYRAEEILSVRSYDLKTVYEEGRDYVFENNALRRTENSRIPYVPEEEYYPAQQSAQAIASNRADKPWLLLMEGDYFCSRQICVTYRHSDEHIAAPAGYTASFSRLLGKLEQGEPVTMVFYGDSITAGANSSDFLGCEPYAPVWAEMVARKLAADYGYELNIVHKGHTGEEEDLHALRENGKYINFVNTAYGGMTTQWGVENVQRRVLYYKSDFVALGFGMNDAAMPPLVYAGLMEELIETIRAGAPEAEMLLVSPMLPNPEAAGFYGTQPQFEEELVALAAAQGVGCAQVTSVHESVIKVKRYYDMTGNNVNHPNDFLARIYAQTVLHAICEA